MSFYEELSRYYDEIFAVSPPDMAWLKTRLTGLKSLADIGCGTGNKTELLAEPGRSIVGLDSDPAMIELAQARHVRPGFSYQVGDMAALGETFTPGLFDGLICLGNTLAHLIEPEELLAFGRDAAWILASGGLLAIQILNYDYLRARRIPELPVIDTEHVIFRRYYDWNGKALRFRTRLEIKGGQVFENDLPLRPILKADLMEMLGLEFDSAEFFGGYDGRPLNHDSLVLMMLARRV